MEAHRNFVIPNYDIKLRSQQRAVVWLPENERARSNLLTPGYASASVN